jgi:hypothetical protein
VSLFERERMSAETILYALYLYFLGPTFRNIIERYIEDERRSHVAVWMTVWKWIQILIDETMLQIGFDQAWLWIAAEPIHRQLHL